MGKDPLPSLWPFDNMVLEHWLESIITLLAFTFLSKKKKKTISIYIRQKKINDEFLFNIKWKKI